MKDFGIDVSGWQGNFNFAEAKAEGVTFVIIKAGGADDGHYTDRYFVNDYNAAKAAGLKVGAYYFGNARTQAQARDEAAHFVSIIKGKRFEYPVFYDVEGSMAQQPKEILQPIITEFLNSMENAGYWAGWYAGLETYYWHVDGPAMAARYSWWLPYWGSSMPALDVIQVWQFGGSVNYIRSNKVAGVVCDQDYVFVDYESQIKAKGKNGFPKSAPAPTPSPAKKPEKGDKIKLKPTATVYGSNDRFFDYVYDTTYFVRYVSGRRLVFAPKMTGAVTGAVDIDQVNVV